MPLPPDLLLRTPEEAVRRICLSLLDEAHAATLRLDDPKDVEALHDFRVAVRRLRSTLRAWRERLEGSVGKKERRALRELQNATGGGRDAEVAAAWLKTQRKGLSSRHRRALQWMLDRLARRHAGAMAHVNEEVRAAYGRMEEGLRSRLEVIQLEVNLSRPPAAATFAEALSERLAAHVDELVRHLARITSLEDREEAHQARIMGKRLRYLVEPVRDLLPDAAEVVKECKRVQDVLGDLNDTHVLRQDLGLALEEAVVEHARRLHELAAGDDADGIRQEMRRTLRPGLLELTRRVQARSRELFTRLEREWLEDAGARLRPAADALTARLGRIARKDVEIERKYLLAALPTLPEETESVEIEQGWIPGTRLHERLRRTRGREGVTYHRTVKLGEGVQRMELEDPTTAEVFERLWPLTEGRRVHKRRHRVAEGTRTWEIDEFLDRDLFLAEVELDDPSATVDVPAWLSPHVEKEVTGEARYTNLELAK